MTRSKNDWEGDLDRVAVITDIHGNLPALQAALGRTDELGIEEIYCGGDLVGYGPRPNEVCALIQERAIPTIYGNYDYAIARDLEDCGCAYVTPHHRELGQQSVAWTLAHTDQASNNFMRELPFDMHFPIGDQDVHLVHGWIHTYGGVLFVYCGSAGKPKDGDPRAAFAILEPRDTGVRASIERVPYDALAVAREVEAAGLPGEYAEKLVAAA
jgi:predicted phosphodiesterase